MDSLTSRNLQKINEGNIELERALRRGPLTFDELVRELETSETVVRYALEIASINRFTVRSEDSRELRYSLTAKGRRVVQLGRLDDYPGEPPIWLVDAARDAALRSPCRKSRRGAVVYSLSRQHPRKVTNAIYAVGYNGLPPGQSCDGSEHCRASCSLRCQHAEQRAVARSLVVRVKYAGRPTYEDTGAGWVNAKVDSDGKVVAELFHGVGLVHVKVNSEGEVAAGGPPSCAVCSGFMLDQGVTEVWLYRRDQDDEAFVWWQCYSIEEFHSMSVSADLERRCSKAEGWLQYRKEEALREMRREQLGVAAARMANIETVPMKCPKCNYGSGQDWEQCGGWCPVSISPHYTGEV